ncbi:MAG TPA: hypothetical protein VD999_04305 [Vitreimonas sp.]|nr:hypothetical protein [Vitreimonas sp.]
MSFLLKYRELGIFPHPWKWRDYEVGDDVRLLAFINEIRTPFTSKRRIKKVIKQLQSVDQIHQLSSQDDELETFFPIIAMIFRRELSDSLQKVIIQPPQQVFRLKPDRELDLTQLVRISASSTAPDSRELQGYKFHPYYVETEAGAISLAAKVPQLIFEDISYIIYQKLLAEAKK